MSRPLARALIHQSRKHLAPIFHVGQVESIQPGPPPELTVIFSGNLAGTPTPNISYLASYPPQVGDFVHAIHTGKPDTPGGADWLVIGAVAQNGTWTALSLVNSWTNLGTPFALAGCAIRGSRVYLGGGITGSIANGSPFTLPSAAWPITEKVLPVLSGYTSTAVPVNLVISTAGVASLAGAAGSASFWMDTLSFPLDY